MPGADSANRERRREIRGDYRMSEPVGKARIEDDMPPGARGYELATAVDRKARWRVHPAIGADNPCRGDKRTDRDHAGGKKVKTFADFRQPEEHDAEESGLKKKCGKNLV